MGSSYGLSVLILVVLAGLSAKASLTYDDVCSEKLPSMRVELERLSSVAIETVASRRKLSGLKSESDLDRYTMSDVRVKFDYFQELEKLISQKQFALVQGLFEDLQESMAKAVLESKRFDWSQSAKEVMAGRIRKVKLQRIEKFLAEELSSLNFFFLWGGRGHTLEFACQKNGLLNSAFFYPDNQAVVICPGTLLEMFKLDGAVTHGSIAFLLAHELAHSIDIDVFLTHHGVLADNYLKAGYDEPFWKEMSADTLGALGFARYVLEKRKNTSFISQNMERFCHLPRVDDGSAIYPGGRERVELVLTEL